MHDGWVHNPNPFSDVEEEEGNLNQEPETCPTCGEEMKNCLCSKDY